MLFKSLKQRGHRKYKDLFSTADEKYIEIATTLKCTTYYNI